MTWQQTHGHRSLMSRRYTKALILERFLSHNPIPCAVGETDDGFILTGDWGRLDFEFSADDGYRLAAKASPEQSDRAWDDVWAEMREDSRDWPGEDTSDWDGIEQDDDWEVAA